MTTKKQAAGWLGAAVVFVGAAEGLRLYTYPDVGNVPTYCYGETNGAKYGQTYTRDQCDEQLAARLVEFDRGVQACVTVRMPDTRRAAAVSLAYNIGIDAFCGSTLVRKLNAGDTVGACDQFLRWNRVKGVVWPGLTKRRERERELCMMGLA